MTASSAYPNEAELPRAVPKPELGNESKDTGKMPVPSWETMSVGAVSPKRAWTLGRASWLVSKAALWLFFAPFALDLVVGSYYLIVYGSERNACPPDITSIWITLAIPAGCLGAVAATVGLCAVVSGSRESRREGLLGAVLGGFMVCMAVWVWSSALS